MCHQNLCSMILMHCARTRQIGPIGVVSYLLSANILGKAKLAVIRVWKTPGSEREASPAPVRGRKRSREEPERVRLRSRKGENEYTQISEETDKEFAKRVNDEREGKYKRYGGIEEYEELTEGKVTNARNRGDHPTGFVNLSENAKKVKEEKEQPAELESLEGGDEYYQIPWEPDEHFASKVNKKRNEKYKETGGIREKEKLTKPKVKDARRKGYHPAGFANIAKNAQKGKTKEDDLISIISDEGKTEYNQHEVETYGSFADRVNHMRERKYRKIEGKEKLTDKRVRDANKKGSELKGFTVKKI